MDSNQQLEELRSLRTIAQSVNSPLPTSKELVRFTGADMQWRYVRGRERATGLGDWITAIACGGLLLLTFEPNLNQWLHTTSFGQFFAGEEVVQEETSEGGPTIQGEPAKIVAIAQDWVGQDFAPGQREQCAYFVRAVLEEAGIVIGVTQQPYDGYSSGEGFANSFFGPDMGELIEVPEQLKPGDLVAFANTYGDYPSGTITHVGIYIGDGQMVHRPTADKPVEEIAIAGYTFAVGVRIVEEAVEKGVEEGGIPSGDANFEKSLEFIFSVEGGYSNHPDDNGGATMMGITKDRAEKHGYTVDQITKEIATEIYYTDYWLAAGCDKFQYPLSMACMNTAVNSGPGKAVEFNGLIGDGDVREEAIAYAQRQENYYYDIVSRKPDQEVFLKGWLNRSKDLKRRINDWRQQ